jgi:hypothetical protein
MKAIVLQGVAFKEDFEFFGVTINNVLEIVCDDLECPMDKRRLHMVREQCTKRA